MSPPPSSTVNEKPDWSRPGKESSRIQNVQAATSLLWEKIAKQTVTKLRKEKTLSERKREFENSLLGFRTQEEKTLFFNHFMFSSEHWNQM
ncbi:hypothetical protein AGOR_G00077650 [Albula goreensis]|uniref:Uncharacterized protein n=1 Tax=Albula goreensis TaxID=1534307 RepID=A0A8T3DN95_9TELE|nr:hypothetical protein AGOR_G00077650 [Albula goreensis]